MVERIERILLIGAPVPEMQRLRSALEQEGFDVVQAEGGGEALERYASQRYDLVLLDLAPTQGSDRGLGLLAKIRSRRDMFQLPLIVLATADERNTALKALSLGANDLISRPVDLGVAVARIRTRLELKHLAELKDSFLGIASHDLKKPTMLIHDISDTLLEEPDAGTVLTEADREALELVRRSADYMMRIIQDFVDLQALDDGRLVLDREPVELTGIIDEILEADRAYAERKGIALAANIRRPFPPVTGDRRRLVQVVENLLGNAIKFAPAGAEVEVRAYTDEGWAVVEVRDTGPGLSDEDMQRLFVKYARLSNRPTGGEQSTGYGLAICRQLVTLLGGHIGARNNTGRGATFWFALPVAEQPAVSQ